MASAAAHRSSGLAIGVISAAIVSTTATDHTYLLVVLTCLAGFAGGTAPDWLENAWWSRRPGKQLWIAHRTWTHWGIAWIALLVVAHANLKDSLIAAPLFGFAAGGLMHLIADWPNPLGVPWLLTKRYSLHWWRSGRCDCLITSSIWTAATVVADITWWQRALCTHLIAAISPPFSLLPPSHVGLLRQLFYPFT